MAALCCRDRGRETSGAGPHHGDGFRRGRRCDGEFGLVAGLRVHQATGDLAGEGVIEAGLVAGDARRDLRRFTRPGLGHEVGIRQHGSRHRHHVGTARGEHLLGDLRRVDPVRGDQRNADLGHQLFRHPGEGRAGHGSGYGGNARLVPADARVDDRGPCGFDGLRQLHHLVMCGAIGHQIDHRQTVDEDEVRPYGGAHPAHHLHRQAHPVLVRSTPVVGALVGMGHEELVQEVTFGPHDLHAVIARLAGALGTGDDIRDLLFNACGVQLSGRERERWVI